MFIELLKYAKSVLGGETDTVVNKKDKNPTLWHSLRGETEINVNKSIDISDSTKHYKKLKQG